MIPRNFALATVLTALFVASLAQVAESAGWCHWRAWSCETSRVRWGHDRHTGESNVRIQCALRRTRSCCNSEPPTEAAASCPSGPSSRRYRDRGAEEWRDGPDYRGLHCPSALSSGWRIIPSSQSVNACATAYPSYTSYGGRATVWCPWEYWSAWQSSCPNSERRRTRRCGCPESRRRGGPPSPSTATCSSSSASDAVETQRKAGCTDGGSLGGGNNRAAGGGLHENTTMTIACGPFGFSYVPIVAGSLAVLVVAGIIVAVCVLLCCKRSRSRGKVAVKFEKSSAPSAPEYGSPAFFASDSAAADIPSVSLKVDKDLDETAPPAYTSQPELRTQSRPPRDGLTAVDIADNQLPPPPYILTAANSSENSRMAAQF